MELGVAAVQMEAKPFHVEENLDRAHGLIGTACHQGAELVVLPELFNTGYTYDRRLLDHQEPIGGPTTQWMRRQSVQRGIYLAACLPEQGAFGCHDTLVLTTPCGTTHCYRKRYPAFFEKLYFSAGRGEGIFHTPLGRIGVMICWDMVQPRLLRELAGRIDLLIISSAWPDMTTGNIPVPFFSGWMAKQPALAPSTIAARLKVPVVYANKAGRFRTRVPFVGLDYQAEFAGGSAVIDSEGVVNGIGHREEGMAVSRLRLARRASGPRLRVFEEPDQEPRPARLAA